MTGVSLGAKTVKAGGILVSVVSEPPRASGQMTDIRTAFFLVEVTTARPDKLADLFSRGKLTPRVGTVLPL